MLGFVGLEGHARLSESLENVHRGTAVSWGGLSAKRGRKTGLEGEDRADHSLACSRGSQLLDPEASTWRTEVGSHTWWPVCYCVALHPREHLDRLAYDGGFLRGATEGSPQPLSSGEMFTSPGSRCWTR